MAEIKNRKIICEYGEIDYTLEYKRVKNINLRIRSDGSIAVSAPYRTPLDFIDGFVRQKAQRIIASQKKIATAQQRNEDYAANVLASGDRLRINGKIITVERIASEKIAFELSGGILKLYAPSELSSEDARAAYENWAKQMCKASLLEQSRRVEALFASAGLETFHPEIHLRKIKTRWGVCSPMRNKITLNTRLFEVSTELAAYVVLHEYAHLLAPNHGAEFWAIVARFMPDWKERRAGLREYE